MVHGAAVELPFAATTRARNGATLDGAASREHVRAMTKTVALDIQGMSCEHCVRSVRGALLAVPGVVRADVRVGHADVEVEDATARDALTAAVAEEGYRIVGA
jgi:copper chaperone CopZ